MAAAALKPAHLEKSTIFPHLASCPSFNGGIMRTTTLPGGQLVPVLGQGTWNMGDDPRRRRDEIAALRCGLDLGMRLIDTAEMYGDGAAETLVGEAISGRRNEVFLVSKVLPQHATRRGTIAACEQSLRRLGSDHIDLYLLHWRGPVPLDDTLAAFAQLQREGKIRHWGVSNFDVDDMTALAGAPAATDQVLYNLTRRGIEHDLLPWCERHGMPLMAYSPLEQNRLLGHPALAEIAARHGATPSQIALAWVLRHPRLIAIPKAASAEHVRQNSKALAIGLSAADLAVLDAAFPAPAGPQALEMI
jgi:diketogulonate reductase-like aldo/keto reductase